MNLKREMIDAKERLDKIEAAIAGLLISPPPVTISATKTVKKVAAKKKAKAKTKKKADPTSVKTTSDQIAQVEM
tara:strand:+ start:1067 stop:1288 length:222 start_codon:yes stop_codon:yes gene_type:complete